MNKYDEMVVRITIFCREPSNFGLFKNLCPKKNKGNFGAKKGNLRSK